MNEWRTAKPVSCFFCGRDLSQANTVQYVAEGAICSMCLAKISGLTKLIKNQTNMPPEFNKVVDKMLDG